MGQGIITKCTTCHDEKEYLLGVGMMYSSLKNVTGGIHWINRRKIDEFSQNGTVISEQFEHRLYFCEKCLTPHSRFWIRLEREGGEVFETVFKCPKCRSRMIQGDLDFTKYVCSLCGMKTLSAIGKMMWD
ncbi:MAG: hypothetical protein ACN4GR_00320 [Arenicellales bacterium]